MYSSASPYQRRQLAHCINLRRIQRIALIKTVPGVSPTVRPANSEINVERVLTAIIITATLGSPNCPRFGFRELFKVLVAGDTIFQVAVAISANKPNIELTSSLEELVRSRIPASGMKLFVIVLSAEFSPYICVAKNIFGE